MIDWQPIETAPKDGSTFLTWSPEEGSAPEHCIDVGGWSDGDWWKAGCGWQWVTHWAAVNVP